MMAALVCPGFGQFMQRRKIAGTVYLLLVLAGLAAMIVFFLRIITAFYKLGFEFEDPGSVKVEYIGLIVAFAYSILIYIISFVDALRASNRPPPPPPPA